MARDKHDQNCVHYWGGHVRSMHNRGVREALYWVRYWVEKGKPVHEAVRMARRAQFTKKRWNDLYKKFGVKPRSGGAEVVPQHDRPGRAGVGVKEHR